MIGITDIVACRSVFRNVWTKIFKTALDTFGKIDILVNNAGINIPCLLVDPKDPHGKYELNEKVYDKVTGVNIKGVYLVAQAVGHEMVKAGGVYKIGGEEMANYFFRRDSW